MPKPHLSNEQIEKAAAKGWHTTGTNLSGPKTEAGRIRSLKNLRPGAHTFEHGYDSPGMKHGGHVRKVLTIEEKEVWDDWEDKYDEDFDLNGSSDRAILDNILMEHVIQYRLMVRKAEKPSLDIDRPLSESQKRLRENLDALGTLRKQRVAQQNDAQQSIATLILAFGKDQAALMAQSQRAQDEEQRMLEDKRARDAENGVTVDAQHRVVEVEDMPEEETPE